MALWVLLTGLVLSSSSNPGSGFGLPVIVVVILLAAAVLGQLSRRVLSVTGCARRPVSWSSAWSPKRRGAGTVVAGPTMAVTSEPTPT